MSTTDTTTFKVNYPEWQQAFAHWALTCGMGIVAAWRYQAKQIASALILGYEPSGKRMWNQSTPPNNRKRGEGALVRDIHRAVFPLRANGFRDVKLRKQITVAVREDDVKKLQALVRAGVFGHDRVHMRVLPAGNEYTAHQQSRASRGRVLHKTPRFATVGNAYLKEYIKESKHAVGQAKGGWAASLEALGGRAPAWVARHKKAGTCVDNLREGITELLFSMRNHAKWADDEEAQRIVDSVMANRAELVKADIVFLAERNWTRNDKGQIVK
jgi:hypothetical protein